MSYVNAALALGLMYVVRKYLLPNRQVNRMAKGRSDKLEFIPFALLLIAMSTLANSGLGRWVATQALAPLFGWVGGWAGVSGAVAATVALALIALAAGCDLIDLEPNGVAKTAVMVLPFLALISVGPVAGFTNDLFGAVSDGGTQMMTSITGQ